MNENVTKINTKQSNIDVFSKRLKEARINAGLSSQKALAKLVEVDRVTINYYEKGDRKPDIEVFSKIADSLNVSYDYLLGYSESTKREYHNTREMTGLSDKAIEVLNNLVNETNNEIGLKELANDKIKTINYLIEKEDEYKILESIVRFLWRTYEINDFFGQKMVDIPDSSGNKISVPVSDLYNAELLEIQRKFGNLKADMEKRK